jgi:hypothetical protein
MGIAYNTFDCLGSVPIFCTIISGGLICFGFLLERLIDTMFRKDRVISSLYHITAMIFLTFIALPSFINLAIVFRYDFIHVCYNSLTLMTIILSTGLALLLSLVYLISFIFVLSFLILKKRISSF